MHLQEDHSIACDVLVTGNKRAARDTVITLIEALGLKGWHAGPIQNAAAAEALTRMDSFEENGMAMITQF